MIKNKLTCGLIFLFGFVLGIISLTALNVNTNDMYLNMLRSRFRVEQEMLAKKAASDQNIIRVLHHRYNVVSTYANDEFSVFNNLEDSFLLPIQLFILKHVVASIETTKGERVAEGIERGKLAFTLEQAGMIPDAQIEWKKAINLANYGKTIDEFKEYVSSIVATEIQNN